MHTKHLLWFGLPLALAVVVALPVVRHLNEGKRYFTTTITYSVGREMIETTNTSLAVGLGPALRQELSGLLVSPTHIANVRLGDEGPPVGDGRASSVLTLTNEHGQGLGIRLRQRVDASARSPFEVLGYWKCASH